jgi:hypothetical protein
MKEKGIIGKIAAAAKTERRHGVGTKVGWSDYDRIPAIVDPDVLAVVNVDIHIVIVATTNIGPVADIVRVAGPVTTHIGIIPVEIIGG